MPDRVPNGEPINDAIAAMQAEQKRVRDAMKDKREFAIPAEYSALWYRLRAMKEMSREQMESMLAYLSGYTETGWDLAYAQSGAKPIYPVEGDPNYNDEIDDSDGR